MNDPQNYFLIGLALSLGAGFVFGYCLAEFVSR